MTLVEGPIAETHLDKSKKLLLVFGLEREQLIEELDGRRRSNERVNVDIDERGHDDLTIETIHEPAMAGYGVGEVFDVERPFEAAREEAAERAHERGEESKYERVKLKRVEVETHRRGEECVLGEAKDGRRLALALRRVGLKRTRERVELDENGGDHEAETDAGDRAAHEALPRLLGRERDELGATVEEAEYVGEYVVADHQHNRHGEPD